jgi:hypothetical protein
LCTGQGVGSPMGVVWPSLELFEGGRTTPSWFSYPFISSFFFLLFLLFLIIFWGNVGS